MQFANSKVTKPFLLMISWMLLACGIQVAHLQLNDLMAARSKANSSMVVVPKYDVIRYLCGGHEQLIADCWWLSFIQYYGDVKKRRVDHNKYAFDYLNLITQLDPKFSQ